MVNRYDYLIVGGGMTAEAAVRGLREIDPAGSIGVISAEQHPPYNRPPLSKGLWKGKPFEKIWRAPDGLAAELHSGRTAQAIDPVGKQVNDDEGTVYTYRKLLLATGGKPRRLPFGGEEVIYFRTLDDYQRLRSLSEQGGRFVVIGGGFIGSEIAAALAMTGREVSMFFPERGIGALLFPPDLSVFLNDYYREKGVEVGAGETVAGADRRGEDLFMRTAAGMEASARGVIAGVGILPDVALAQAAGLSVENGIVVDESLRTSQPDIYAAGDVASFHNPALGQRLRVEHEDNANAMGRAAGQAMAGAQVRYDHLPYFYSDLFDLGYEAVGILDPRLETFSDWREPYRKGVIYYLDQGRVRGVILWNVWDQVEAARRLIAEPGPFKASDLKGRLPAT